LVSSARTRLEQDFDPDAVQQLKAAADHDLTVGGPALAAQAIRAGLVDEYHLFLTPIVVGDGKRWLPNDVRLELDLVDECRLGNRVVHLTIAPGPEELLLCGSAALGFRGQLTDRRAGCGSAAWNADGSRNGEQIAGASARTTSGLSIRRYGLPGLAAVAGSVRDSPCGMCAGGGAAGGRLRLKPATEDAALQVFYGSDGPRTRDLRRDRRARRSPPAATFH
jgi:hypothetical protein